MVNPLQERIEGEQLIKSCRNPGLTKPTSFKKAAHIVHAELN